MISDSGLSTYARTTSAAPQEAPLLHVVGAVTDEVFSFLGPATRALATEGRIQKIIVIDVDAHRYNVEQLDVYATVIRIPKTGNPLGRWQAVFRACRSEFEKDGVGAVHVHGLLPFMLVSMGFLFNRIRTPVVFSPHGSRSLGNLRFPGRFALLAARSATRTSAIVTVPSEAGVLGRQEETDIVESPVGDAFFLASRSEATKPLIVTGGRQGEVRSVEVFMQLAVLLSGEELGLKFIWLGSVPPAAEQGLYAANVKVLPVTHDQECAAHMAAGWMYVAPWFTRGFPLFLVQAMAAGLACVALDCEQHRQVIENGKNGFLCATEQEMVQRIAELVDDCSLRKTMGAAARALAEVRFSEENFKHKLLTAYSTRW